MVAVIVVSIATNSDFLKREAFMGWRDGSLVKRVLAALPEDLDSVPSTHFRQFTALPAPGDSVPSSGLHRHCTHMNIPAHRHTYTHN